jgi:hypothetical protein
MLRLNLSLNLPLTLVDFFNALLVLPSSIDASEVVGMLKPPAQPVIEVVPEIWTVRYVRVMLNPSRSSRPPTSMLRNPGRLPKKTAEALPG